MSTKDLMDRLENAPRTAKARPAPEPKPGDARPAEVRVGSGVVRRRAAPPPPPVEEPAPRTILRRPARPAVEPPPSAPVRPAPPVQRVAETLPPAAAAPEPPAEVAPAPEPTPVVAAPVAPPPVEAAPVEAAPEPAPVAAPPVEVAPEPTPIAAPPVAAEPPPVAAAPAEPAAPEAVAAPPVPEAPPPEPTMERAVIIERPGGPVRPVGAPAAAAPTARAARGLPDTPILPGLGRAVVSLPAGYDPTDPTGAKRRAREQAATQPRWPGAGPRRDAPAAPAPGAADDHRNDRRRGRRGERSELSMADIAGARMRKGKGKSRDARPRLPQKLVKRRVRIDGEISVANLAHEMGVKAAELVKVLIQLGTPATMNEIIDFDTASVVAQELGHEVYNVAFDEAEHLIQHAEDEHEDLPERPPVVTVMGHVDHGKTTLLDTIRATRVAAREAGGITQHIGAYTVDREGRQITFLDTPGHAAFSAMRARGAKATDIVILVVAADDGVMPQTVEAISHAKAAGVPIIVAVNKCDKPGVDTDRIRRELLVHELVPEEYGGDTIFVNISALKGTGIDDLLDNVLIVAEVADLRANPDRHAEGVVLESRLETGRGAVASLLVQTGTLKQGDILVIGSTWGRVRAMHDDTGKKLKEAGPSTPVEIFGLQEVPAAGAEFVVVESEKDARTLSEHRSTQARAGALTQRQRLTVDDLFKMGGPTATVQYAVLKTDVGGTLEALRGALEAIDVPGTQIKILHAAIGPVNESDVNLAAGQNGVVLAFNVKPDAKARKAADQYNVEIKTYDVIYNVIDDMTARLSGLLEPVYEERKVGEAEVRATFNIPRIGTIAGCMVLDGQILRGGIAKVLREGKIVHESRISSLKRFKEDVKEVEKGFECGIGVEDFPTVAEGDLIQVYSRVEVPRELPGQA